MTVLICPFDLCLNRSFAFNEEAGYIYICLKRITS